MCLRILVLVVRLLHASEFQVFTRFSKGIGERQPTCQLVAGRRSSVDSLRNPKEFVQRKERELSWPGNSLDYLQFSGKSENRLSRPGLFAFRNRLAPALPALPAIKENKESRDLGSEEPFRFSLERESRKSSTMARSLLMALSLSGSVMSRRHNPSETESK